jgi:RNA polymerase-binding transcription factor DksA
MDMLNVNIVMEHTDIERYRVRLEADRKTLLVELAREQTPEDFGNDIDSADEEADEAESFGDKLAISEALKERISAIDAALARVAVGTYGACEGCKGPIETAVLDLAPESTLCQKCKQQGE